MDKYKFRIDQIEFFYYLNALNFSLINSLFKAHGLLNSCPRSRIHLLLTHFWPYKTGQAACLVLKSPFPLGKILCQNTAEPRMGTTLAFISVKTVAPPSSGASR